MILTGIATIKQIEITLLVVFNVGIVTRIVMILSSAIGDEEGQSPKKVIKNHVIAAIVVNLAAGLVTLVKKYYS